jgi:predicted Zn-dependent protease
MVAGCQLIEIKPSPPASTDKNALDKSRQLAAKGRYGEAIRLLDRASGNRNLSTAYSKELESFRNQQKTLEEELNDQLLISNTSALKNQLPILTKLSQASPDKHHYARLLQETRETLQSMQKALSECAWRHFKRNNALSKDCLTLALSLKQDKADQDLMEHLLKEQIQYKKAVAKKEQANREQKSKKRVDKNLTEAQKLIESGQLKDAKRALKLVLKESPKNETAKKLLADINKTLKKYIENLLLAGDRLYRDGEIESAKATWRAALTLDPMDVRAREKIQRAQRVLDNLENLRKTNEDDTNKQ